MRHIFICLILALSLDLSAQSTPVYVQPNNPAPTGHFDLKQLKQNSIAHDQYEWLWVKDDFGHAGWVLKSALMLPLDFSRQAILAKGEAIYPEPKSYNLPQVSLEKAQIVSLLGRHRDWYKVLYKQDGKKYSGWVQSRYLRPYSKDPGYFYSMKEVPLRKKPQMKSQFLGQVKTGTPIIPIKIVKSWAFVKSGKKKGYIPLQNIRSRVDIAMKVKTPEGYYKPHPKLIHKKINEIFANPLWVGTGEFTIELKSKP
ncbi:MAG: hypothetical protein MJK18_09395, partial [Bdellovibrionales bacterium]|nr:hypothetical protein [Bdellovibrionales bacterium]